MKSFLLRVTYALTGWLYFFKNETNGKIQLVIAALVIVSGFVFEINKSEWIYIMLCIGCVIGLEMVNTSIETLANRLHPEKHPEIKVVKDVAAGAVLWAAIICVIIGILIFLPKVKNLFA